MAFGDGIVSTNVVGYNTTTLESKNYNATGACFLSVGGEDGFTLRNVTPTAYDWESDFLYVINPDDCTADNELVYFDATTAAALEIEPGWYDYNTVEPFNDVEWGLGTGFMTSFGSGTPNFVYSGEVCVSTISVDYRGKVYAIVPNPLPRNVAMSEITATGFDWESDFLYIINPDDCTADAELVYFDATTAAAFELSAGWYDYNTVESYNEYIVAPGQGFQSSFGSENVIINFPSAL